MSIRKLNRRIGKDLFPLRVKVALLERGITVTDLAEKLCLSRNGVSRAINHPVLPTVRRRIEKELALR
jgi:DNA-binding Xre family transcriptional regulator